MAIGRLLRSVLRYGPIAYPIIRKMMNKKKAANNAGKNTAPQPIR